MTDEVVRCPFCGSSESELLSLFGQQLLTIQYYCRSCKTPFEKIKDEETLKDAARSIAEEERPSRSPRD